jgi:hypothetical protein
MAKSKDKAKLSDFQVQPRNTNKHKPRGMGMLDESIATDGWIGAVTTTANNKTFAGSARLETAQGRFGDESEPIVFDIDGTRPVILRRIDIPDENDPKAIRLGIADNRVAEVNNDTDIGLIQEYAEIIDLNSLYFDDELAKLAAQQQEVIDHQEPDFLKFSDNNDSLPAYASDRSGGNKQPIPIVVGSRTMQRWNEYKESVGIKNDTAAFEMLLESQEI